MGIYVYTVCVCIYIYTYIHTMGYNGILAGYQREYNGISAEYSSNMAKSSPRMSQAPCAHCLASWTSWCTAPPAAFAGTAAATPRFAVERAVGAGLPRPACKILEIPYFHVGSAGENIGKPWGKSQDVSNHRRILHRWSFIAGKKHEKHLQVGDLPFPRLITRNVSSTVRTLVSWVANPSRSHQHPPKPAWLYHGLSKMGYGSVSKPIVPL